MAREMKDSGIEWIGEIPENWEVNRVKHMFKSGKGLSITKENLIDAGLAVVSYGQIHSKTNTGVTIESDLLRFVDFKYQKYYPQCRVYKYDFIFADTSEDYEGCGNCVYKRDDAILFAGYHSIILHSIAQQDNRYFAYLFKTDCWRKQIREVASGVKLFTISQNALVNSSVISPPFEQQQKIADFLDKKCAEIDSLSSDIQSQIHILEDYKKSVITEAVTKGLNPDVEMKDSGIEWIGEMPKVWECKKVKYTSRLNRGIFGHRPRNDPAYYNGNYPFIQTGDVANAKQYITSYFQTLNELGKGVSKKFPKGTIAITLAANVGDVAILDFSAYFPDSVMAILPHKNYLNKYIYYILSTMKAEFLKTAVTNTQLNLNVERVGNVYMPVTSNLQEQQEIIDYLDKRCIEIDSIITEKEEQLVILEQYKKSLIYEYVIGKKEVPDNNG